MNVYLDGWSQWICILVYVIIFGESIRSYLLHQKKPQAVQESRKSIRIGPAFHLWFWKLILSFTLLRLLFFIFPKTIGTAQEQVDNRFIKRALCFWLLEFPNGLVCFSMGYLIFFYAHLVHLKIWPKDDVLYLWGGKIFICFGALIMLLVTLFALLRASVTIGKDTPNNDMSFRIEVLQQAYWIYSAGVWMGLAFLLGKYKRSMYQFLREERRKHHLPTVHLSQLYHFAKANTYLLILLFSRSIFCGYQFLRKDVQALIRLSKPMVLTRDDVSFFKISHGMYEYFLWEFLWFIFLHQLIHAMPLTALSSSAAERWQENTSSSYSEEGVELKTMTITYHFKAPRPIDILTGLHEAIATPHGPLHPIYEASAEDHGSLGPSSQVPLLVDEHEDV